jgi:hypothetical protein
VLDERELDREPDALIMNQRLLFLPLFFLACGGGEEGQRRDVSPSSPGLCPADSMTSEVTAQAVADLRDVSDENITEILGACRAVARVLAPPPEEEEKAEAPSSVAEKAEAWCALAAQLLREGPRVVANFGELYAAPKNCVIRVVAKARCQGMCEGAGPCDTNANPMTCTGGELANGGCTDGKLEGGCPVAKRCDESCDAAVAAGVVCDTPSVTVSPDRWPDPAEAARAGATLSSELPKIFRLNGECGFRLPFAKALWSNALDVTDVSPACKRDLDDAASRATTDVEVCGLAASLVFHAMR